MVKTFSTVTLQLGTAELKHVARLTLNRPKKKNAITTSMYGEIQSAFEAISADASTKAVILTAAGDYYSSGNDLSNFAQLMNPVRMAAKSKEICYNFVDSFISCSKPIVAAVNGPAIGIAVTTLGLCDRRLAVSNATFHTPFRALGQAPEGCSSMTFETLMGKEIAEKILEDGLKFTAEEALKFGFLHSVVRDAQELTEMAQADAVKAIEKGSRWYEEYPGLVHELRRVNQREVDVLEEAWISPACFEALDKYLTSRNQRMPALMLRTLNRTRFLWHRR